MAWPKLGQKLCLLQQGLAQRRLVMHVHGWGFTIFYHRTCLFSAEISSPSRCVFVYFPARDRKFHEDRDACFTLVCTASA